MHIISFCFLFWDLCLKQTAVFLKVPVVWNNLPGEFNIELQAALVRHKNLFYVFFSSSDLCRYLSLQTRNPYFGTWEEEANLVLDAGFFLLQKQRLMYNVSVFYRGSQILSRDVRILAQFWNWRDVQIQGVPARWGPDSCLYRERASAGSAGQPHLLRTELPAGMTWELGPLEACESWSHLYLVFPVCFTLQSPFIYPLPEEERFGWKRPVFVSVFFSSTELQKCRFLLIWYSIMFLLDRGP